MTKYLRYDVDDLVVEDQSLTLLVSGEVPLFCEDQWKLDNSPCINLECEAIDKDSNVIYSIDVVARLNMDTSLEVYSVDDFPTFTVWYENDRDKQVSQAVYQQFVSVLSDSLDDDFEINQSYYSHW